MSFKDSMGNTYKEIRMGQKAGAKGAKPGPKHGKDSANRKKCARYRQQSRLEKNRARKLARHLKRLDYFKKRRENV